ncbi:BA75_00412T0 [Komagataella pastoris]|uniref:BA75_00412T0 n=1 Tax=Komagataella pastoris TaxID=4922 RepID=A0A1B2J943_PICPA|nr:BA75_00412T0 [Komagataella pastoris]
MIGSFPISWDQLVEIVNRNDIDKLYRSRDCKKCYDMHKQHLIYQGSSVENYVLQKLQWHKGDNGNYFGESSRPYQIERNQFPYYFTPDLVHFVAWLKTEIPPDPHSPLGDISDETRKSLDALITELFVLRVGIDRSRLIWFRNWGALQSIKGVPHIHIVVKDLSKEEELKISTEL